MKPLRMPAAEAGLTLVEVLVAAGIALALAALGGFLFLGQLRNYRDLDAQARIQTQAKLASQGMARDLSNTGAVLDDKRLNFVMRSDRVQVAWIDLKGRYCRTSDTVTTSYSVSRGHSGDTLLQTVRCNRRAATRRPVVIGLGRIGLAFAYFDRNGLPTAIPAEVRQVEFDLDIRSPQGKSLADRRSNPRVRVELVN